MRILPKRSWRMLWTINRRKLNQRIVALSLLVAVLAWVLVSIAVGETLPTDSGAMVAKEDLIQLQWWVISGLIGLVGVLVGFIIVRQMNNQRADMRLLWEKKLGKEEHRDMDHSILCVRCRDLSHIKVE